MRIVVALLLWPACVGTAWLLWKALGTLYGARSIRLSRADAALAGGIVLAVGVVWLIGGVPSLAAFGKGVGLAFLLLLLAVVMRTSRSP